MFFFSASNKLHKLGLLFSSNLICSSQQALEILPIEVSNAVLDASQLILSNNDYSAASSTAIDGSKISFLHIESITFDTCLYSFCCLAVICWSYLLPGPFSGEPAVVVNNYGL